MLEQNKIYERQPSLLSEEEKRLTAKQLLEFHHSGIFDNVHHNCYKKLVSQFLTFEKKRTLFAHLMIL